VPHPVRGSFKTVGCPLKLSASPVTVETSPLLGEHTDDVLQNLLGMSKEEVEKMRAEGVV